MAEFSFFIPGKPQPWRRARTNGKRHFKDAQTKANQSAWAWAAIQARGPRPLLDGPVVVSITALFTPPKRTPKARLAAMLRGEIVPTMVPDSDNVAKNCDGLNGVVWLDDAQVTDLHVRKRYAEVAGVEVRIRSYDAAVAA